MKTHLGLLIIFSPLALAETAPAVVAPEAGATTEVQIQPTRWIADSAATQVKFLRARLAINGKEQGPFGLNQDPGKQGTVFKLPQRRPDKRVATPFADVVKAVPVAAVFPSEQEFLVGPRTISTGDTFPLVVHDEKITVRVESVRSNGVVFKNLKSGETATKRLDMMPDGITPGGEIQSVDGMIASGSASKEPLHVDLSGLPPANPTRSP